MAVVIRLQRHGAKKRPYYHIVAIDSRCARDSGNILERVGSYDPMQPRGSEKRVAFDADKVKTWMAKGAKPSDRVYRFLAAAGIVAARVIPNQTKKDKQSEKTLMKLKDREAKLAKAREAEEAASAAPVAEEIAPVAEEAPAGTVAAE
ncbi:MAG: 30S ribosomal protein S16 [Rickettsiales bacterium]|jgi:small subunit ribosomal protein S16|nr:30S ribosomal protein S16 [Rickettsiales bacterium]